MGSVLSGSTEGAAVVPEDGAGDHPAVWSLQVVRPAGGQGRDQVYLHYKIKLSYISVTTTGRHKLPEEALGLPVPVAEAAVLHFLHVHLGVGVAGRWRIERRHCLMILHPQLSKMVWLISLPPSLISPFPGPAPIRGSHRQAACGKLRDSSFPRSAASLISRLGL